ncbi:hypothetical protein BGZ63DRAFT_428526 [Mariannaea sp. PMI_226]|nr:hypothetical protein BGZ63DRAFT_428526 [Mariannaea sp. PMI_226]
MDHPHILEYKLRDLPTRAITLFPDQAQIQRDIKDVFLKPGINEVKIIGLSPTVNQQSIKVEGSGLASIVGLTTEYIFNQERFEDVYPDTDSEISEDDVDHDDSDEDAMQPHLQKPKDNSVHIADEIARTKEVTANADHRIKILNTYCNSLNKIDGIDLAAVISIYKIERENAQADRMAARIRERELTEQKVLVDKEQARQMKVYNKNLAKVKKSQAKKQKLRNREKQRRERRKDQIAKEKARIRWERMSVWPKSVYTVTIQLEVNAAFTPRSSRRGSVSSDVDRPLRSPTNTMEIDEPTTCDLVLTYVTNSAYWTPSYDLQLSTPTNSGSLCFDACLNNTTCETWENCKITLSTSQTSFVGPNDAVPFLQPWNIKMASKGNGKSAGSKSSGIAESVRETQERAKIREKQRSAMPLPRDVMFGDPYGLPPPPLGVPSVPPQPVNGVGNHMQQDYQMQLMLLEQQNKKRLMMARQEPDMINPTPQAPGSYQTPPTANPQAMQAHRNQQLMQAQQQAILQQAAQQQAAQHQQLRQLQQQGQQMQMQMAQQPMQQQQQQQMPPPALPMPQGGIHQAQGSGTPPVPTSVLNDFDPPETANWGSDNEPALDFQESLIEEIGMTTTYDLPGRKTLAPKFTATKQRVARVNFSQVSFNHIVVAKYHAAAYLKATLKNNSKWALLKGPGSLILDGSFMGKIGIPRCSVGDNFILNLGIDPAIKVLYQKAEVKRSATGLGMFRQEESSEFTRCIKLHNTRANSSKPATIFVFDQIPVSEDERLRVDLVYPRGVTSEGPRVSTGLPGRDTPAHKDWGKAGVVLKKNGHLSWDVSLNPGKLVKLDVEYSVSMPTGESAVDCNAEL